MTLLFLSLLLTTFYLLLPSYLFAASGNVGTDAFLFTRIGFDARGSGLGGSRVAAVDDITGLIWNPAGLARARTHELMFASSRIFDDQYAHYLGYCRRGFGPGTVGIGLTYVDLGDFEVTRVAGGGGIQQNLGTTDGDDLMMTIGYGWTMFDRLDLGFSGKVMREKLADESATGFAIDAGFRYRLPRDWTIGLAIQNIGPPIEFISRKDDLPLLVKAGVSNVWKFDNAGNGRDRSLQVEIDLQKPSSNTVGVNLGAEFRFIEYLALRVGWDSLIDDGSGLAVGFGVNLQDVEVSYAYVDADELDNQQRITVAYRWGEEKSRESWVRSRESKKTNKDKTVVGAGLAPARQKTKKEKTIVGAGSKPALDYRSSYQNGMRAFLDKNYPGAVEKLLAAEPDYRADAQFYKMLGLACYYTGDHQQSKQYLRRSLEIEPDQSSLENIIRYLD